MMRGVELSEPVDDHITHSRCVNQGLADQWSAVSLSILVRETVRQGYVAFASLAQDLGRRPIKMCLIDRPAPCCLGYNPCASPCEHGRCARKAGCAWYSHVWVSKAWPPVCQTDWPDEPHCGDIADPGYDWRATLVHELGNVIRLRFLSGEGYDATRLSAYYAPGGPVSVTTAAVGKLE